MFFHVSLLSLNRCDICPKSFVDQSNLTTHRRTHGSSFITVDAPSPNSSKPLQMNSTEESFASSGLLALHSPMIPQTGSAPPPPPPPPPPSFHTPVLQVASRNINCSPESLNFVPFRGPVVSFPTYQTRVPISSHQYDGQIVRPQVVPLAGSVGPGPALLQGTVQGPVVSTIDRQGRKFVGQLPIAVYPHNSKLASLSPSKCVPLPNAVSLPNGVLLSNLIPSNVPRANVLPTPASGHSFANVVLKNALPTVSTVPHPSAAGDTVTAFEGGSTQSSDHQDINETQRQSLPVFDGVVV